MCDMGVYEQFNQIFAREERGIATITGQKGNGKLIAQTEAGATVILTGQLETGKKCYYDKRSNRIISEAPSVPFLDLPV